jgi:3-(3-hydroxy-phenyl)propionate hydroxylase
MSSAPRAIDVLIVGGGPTGLAAANALGQVGVEVLLVEQDPSFAELPRAVSVDDEAMRLMQSLGLSNAARQVALPGTGTKFFGARGQLLVYGQGPDRMPFGHPVKNLIDHPSFQRVLLDGLKRFPNVTVRYATRFEHFEQDVDGVTAQIAGDDGVEEFKCDYLIGADGGRSRIRQAIGQEPMAGSAFNERWLVLDTINDQHDERFAMHHGCPRRPRVVIVGRDGRCRYEFLVHDDEQIEHDDLVGFATRLVAPYRTLEPADVVRCTIYRFYALVAREFSQGRVFLAGDAAHMMPPFAGQGLNSGLRDAANLSWKLAAVLNGSAGSELLSTYTAERQPHVSAMVRLSVRMGAVMMTRHRGRAWIRDFAFAVSKRLPLAGRFFGEMRFKPEPRYTEGFLVGRSESRGPIGAMAVQPRVLTSAGSFAWLDDEIGPGFGLLALDTDSEAFARLRSPIWERLNVVKIHIALDDRLPARVEDAAALADADGLLADQLGSLRGKFVLVRPDRYVAAAFAPDRESEVADRLAALLGIPLTVGEEVTS